MPESIRLRTRKRIKTLIVGCGKIGAGSGTHSHRRESHAGSLAGNNDFHVYLYDPDPAVAAKAQRSLRIGAVPEITADFLGSCDCAVIASPSSTHADYALRCVQEAVPLVVCEKPLCTTRQQLQQLIRATRNRKSRILVNYTRRFQPAYLRLATIVKRELQAEQLAACCIRYQRGFLNNASHGLDLLQFLTGWNIADAQFEITSATCDEFADDPTITGGGAWNDAALSLAGIPQAKFSLFEIDLFFQKSAVRIQDRGNEVTILKGSAKHPAGYYPPLRLTNTHANMQADPFEHLYCHVRRMFGDHRIPDNWAESVRLTSWMLDVLERV